MKFPLRLATMVIVAGCLPLAAIAASSAQQEATTAQAHAMMSQSATSVKMAKTHLHHVINCLVGPDGKGFDKNAADPCKGKGKGAIPDASGNSALHAKLETALNQAQAGLNASSLDDVHNDAAKVAATLKDTGSQKKKASGGYSW